MEKIVGQLLQGTPTAIVAGIIILVFVNPINTKVDRVMGVINREIIPLINELKEGRGQSLPVQPVTQLKDIEKGIAELKSEILNVRATIDDAKRVSLVASSLGSASIASLEFKAGDIIRPEGAGYAGYPMSSKAAFNLKVTDPAPLMKIRGEVLDAMNKSGLQVIKEPR